MLHELRRRLNAADLAVYRRVRSLARSPVPAGARGRSPLGADEVGWVPDRTRWIRRWSRLGEHGALWLALGGAGALLDGDRRGRWLRGAAAVGSSYALSTSIKVAIGRVRPAVEDLPHLMATPTGLSFPSSHATSSFAAARAYGTLIPAPPLYAAAAAMACSRLYLGVHYPSDVAAGAALGLLVGSVACR